MRVLHNDRVLIEKNAHLFQVCATTSIPSVHLFMPLQIKSNKNIRKRSRPHPIQFRTPPLKCVLGEMTSHHLLDMTS